MYQFMHIEGYARSASQKSKKPKRTVQQVIDEVLREVGATPHIAKPGEPSFLLGDRESVASIPTDIEKTCTAWKASGNKGVRKDAQVLLTVVASFQAEEESDMSPKEWNARYELWKKKSMAWLKAEWGDKLRAVVLHEDEKHPHIHAYVIQDDGHPDIAPLHPGKAAVTKVEQANGTPKECGQAFVDAMRATQDRFFNAVGAQCGMTRDGPKRSRQTYAEWKARQHDAKVVSAYKTAAYRQSAKAWSEKVLKETAIDPPAPPTGLDRLGDPLLTQWQKDMANYGRKQRERAVAAAELKAQAERNLELAEGRVKRLRNNELELDNTIQALHRRVAELEDSEKRLNNVRQAMLGQGVPQQSINLLEGDTGLLPVDPVRQSPQELADITEQDHQRRGPGLSF